MGFEIELPDDFLSDLLSTDFVEIATQAAEECAPMLKESMQSSLKSSISNEGDSELVNSVKVSKPKQSNKTNGVIVNVGPSGKSNTYYYQEEKKQRKYAVTNVLKAVWLEYGNAHQSAKPWLDSATNNCKQTIMDKMQEIYNNKVGSK